MEEAGCSKESVKVGLRREDALCCGLLALIRLFAIRLR